MLTGAGPDYQYAHEAQGNRAGEPRRRRRPRAGGSIRRSPGGQRSAGPTSPSGRLLRQGWRGTPSSTERGYPPCESAWACSPCPDSPYSA
ncbi:hypothetical protein C791_7570 [Amycolatopsis azurea DSM 43854]|uniref:Uncharacterized protein n=1 Tax=Amycolatopsis azurea DSM 43854 TaxID=1238180 RepID=M2PVX8_9PSEU|nr:hypothetical protein C791_7570 [Amycolatopsis azurea DSM 43854]